MSDFIKTLTEATEAINAKDTRSAWGRGVATYTAELLENIAESVNYNGAAPAKICDLIGMMLNGADNFNQYSHGGSSLIYDGDIAKTLCNPSELKRTRNGENRPNPRENWLDVQARALYQASLRIIEAFKTINHDSYEIY